jgi:ATP-binding protein involved in chromosome partitioning
MSNVKLTVDEVQNWLSEFKDPETGRDIVAAKQVHDLSLSNGKLSVCLGLTTFSSPLWEETRQSLVDFLHDRINDSTEVEVRVEPHQRAATKIGEVGLRAKAVVAVGSGKGGVGKSTIATTLAYSLARAGCSVGLLDADIYGPSIPHLVGTKERPTMANERIVPVTVDGVKILSVGMLTSPDQAVIWRGPMLHGAITQFFRDTEWGELDWMIVDMPPGTGDVALSLSQLLPLTGAVVVCTPQDVALLDAVKAISMFQKVGIDVLGMVENMSNFVCPDCGSRHEVFGSGGARRRSEELSIPFLGELPLNIQLRLQGDAGNVPDSLDDADSKPYLDTICRGLVLSLAKRRRKKPLLPSLPVLGDSGNIS